jgi:adenylate cyclase
MPAEVWRFEDFELDPNAYRLRHKDRIVRLERIPFELLCLLVERRGELVTREEILEKVWGKGVFVDSESSINTAIRKIRRALDDNADAPRFLVTIPARGYRFVASIQETDGTMVAPRGVSIPPVDSAPPPGQSRAASIYPAQTLRLPLTDKPSIVVLPFTNLSGDREQEYFSDGLTDELITSLSGIPGLFVIARTSAFTYKGRATKVQDISREMGVRFVLDGSVRRAANRVRVTAQLVDATTGGHLWAERYDRPMNDIFALQDEIVRRIVTTLNLQLGLWELGVPVDNRRTDNLDAYDCYLRGLEYYSSFTKLGYFKARQMFEKAVDLDAKYATAYKELMWTHFIGWFWQWDPDPHGLDRAFELGQQAIALDDSLASAHTRLGVVYLFKRQYERGVSEAERAVVLDQNSAYGYAYLSYILSLSGRPAKAIAPAEKAMRLGPRQREFYLFHEGFAYVLMGRNGYAVDPLKSCAARTPNNLNAHIWLASAYAELGREGEARAEVAEVTRISPDFSLEVFEQMLPVRDRVLQERRLVNLRKAGLK